MIDKSLVKGLVNEWLEDNEYFLVDINVSADNKIVVEIDHKDGVWIEDCAELSKYIEEHLDREKEDFELEVGSAGIGQPFKVLQQYQNHVGDEVEVLVENKKVKGVLKSVGEDDFVVTVVEKQKIEGQKKAQMVEVDKTFKMDEVKYTKYLINFK
ncbi:MAG: ribosome assembly cofactor RimP [Prevotellaceae bacterium]|nr:ribosome assembly cofactor RimP [Prevotellaceae bacterium]